MTLTAPQPGAPPAPRLPRVLLVDRGDPLAEPLSAAMRRRFDVIDRADVELSHAERLLVAATTFRPDRHGWTERFYKSNLAVALRSRRARAALGGTGRDADVVLQTHALFETGDRRTVLYLDCTHRQSLAQWPAWNPLRGRRLDRWLERERRQFHQAAHVFTLYEGTARSVVEQYGVPPDRVSVVGAGINFETLPPRPEPRAARLDDGHHRGPTVLFVGNDFERKGGPALLEAFALLRARLPGARLLLAGGPYTILDQDGVEHLGRVTDRDELSHLYAAADVFCLPSVFDPFPGVLLEAMAHGLPCVATPTCGIPEIVTDDVTGLLVAPGGDLAVDLADALHRLLTGPEEAERMGRRGRLRVEERFLWPHVLARMAPVLERLAAPTDPDRPSAPHDVRRGPTPRGDRP